MGQSLENEGHVSEGLKIAAALIPRNYNLILRSHGLDMAGESSGGTWQHICYFSRLSVVQHRRS